MEQGDDREPLVIRMNREASIGIWKVICCKPNLEPLAVLSNTL